MADTLERVTGPRVRTAEHDWTARPAPPAPAGLRVAFVTTFPANPDDPCGGVEAVSVHLLRALAGWADLELHVVTMDADRREASVAAWGPITVHRLPRPSGRLLTAAVGAGGRLLREYLLGLRPDVVHAHDFYGILVRGLALPRVFTIHGFIHEDTRVSGERLARWRSWLWRRAETAAWADQPHVIAISPYVRERLHGIATGTIHDIDNPVPEPCFAVRRACVRPIVFSAGAICARKNTLGLVRGVARLVERGVDVELRLSGGGGGSAYERNVAEHVRRQGLREHVKLLGRIDYGAILAELSQASVFALVSLEENSPMSIEEAMAAGVPVVASNRCGMPYLVRDGESGFLVNPHDPEEIARRLEQILEDEDLRIRMGTKGRQIALDRFHPEPVARRTREVYRQAVRDARNGHAPR
ncbi:MAG: glycosyltransferase family 4 protein [Phycisphaerae bacterium]|jgi:glycosyltransferase involved in cell wall biosynthesis